MKLFLKTCFVVFFLANWNISEFVYCQNQTLNENVVATFYRTFYTIVKLSNSFHQFPMRDDFKKSIPSPETQTLVFHTRLLKLLELYGISKDCREDVLQVNIGLENGEEWARRMVDSTGKPDARLADLRFNMVGSFDQCVKVNVNIQKSDPNSATNTTGDVSYDHAVKGTYFVTYIVMPPDIVPASSQYLISPYFPRHIRIGSCLPDTCSATDVNLVVQAVAGQIETRTSPVPSKTFSQKYTELTTAGYVIIGLLCFLAILLVMGTSYDILVLKLKLICQKPPADIKPLHHIKTDTDITDGARGTNGEYLKETDNTAAENMTKEVESLLERRNGSETKGDNNINNPAEKHTGKLHELFVSFSVIRHCEEFLEVRESQTRIGAIEGIRVVTMFWIILMHNAIFVIYVSGNSDLWYRDKDGNWTFFALIVPHVVDSFFTISGFLVTYLSLKGMKAYGGARKFPWWKYYLYRFWRLSPTFYLVFFVFWKVFPSLTSGPLWVNHDKSTSQLHTCDNAWWKILLYLNNFMGKEMEYCFGHSWYLAADTQFYIFSPLLLILFFNFPKIAVVIASFLAVASAVAAGVLAKVFKFIPSLSLIGLREGENIFMIITHYYPTGHLAPWMIGMVLGYVLHSRRNTIRVSKLVNVAGWCLAALSIMLIVYLPATGGSVDTRNMKYNEFTTLYMALSKPMWSGAVAWVIFSCAIGQGGFINTLLSWKPFVILGRLTYCTYLIHVMVLLYGHYSRRLPYHTSDVNVAFDSVSTTVMSYGIGFVVSVCVERPMFSLKNMLFKDERP